MGKLAREYANQYRKAYNKISLEDYLFCNGSIGKDMKHYLMSGAASAPDYTPLVIVSYLGSYGNADKRALPDHNDYARNDARIPPSGKHKGNCR